MEHDIKISYDCKFDPFKNSKLLCFNLNKKVTSLA